MSDGFRKAFLGFNCNDVIDYVKKTHGEFSAKEEKMKSDIEDLSSRLANANAELNEAKERLARADKQIAEYKEREDEIGRISENIGKLYIVSQANARAVTSAAEETRKLAESEVQKNISALKSAHEQITNIIKGVTDTSVEFTDSMKTLSNELEKTVVNIDNTNCKSDEILKQSQAILQPVE